MAREKLGNNTILEYSLDSGTTWVVLSKKTSIKFSKLKAGDIDSTHIDSTNKTSQPGLIDYGTVDFTIRYDSDITDLVTGWLGGSDMQFRVTLNDTKTTTKSKIVITGYVNDFDPTGEIKVDEMLMNNFVVKINAYAFTKAS